jgi:hypothetical protein
MERFMKKEEIMSLKVIILKDKEKMENIFLNLKFNIKELLKIINLMV